MLTLRRLSQLIALAEERSFTRASRQLNMTQPALSRAIAVLEEEAGLLLFERRADGVVPTPAGIELIREARRILGSVDLVEHNLLMQGKGLVGRVSLAIGPLSTNFLLARALADFVREAPEVVISAVVRETSAIVDGVLEGRYDFGICTANTFIPDASLVVEEIARLRMGLFVNRDHPLLQRHGPIPWDALMPYPRATGRLPLVLKTNRDAFHPLDTTLECNDFEVLRHLTRSTEAIWLAAAEIVREEVERGDFVQLLPEPTAERAVGQIVIIRQKGRTLSPAVQRLIASARKIAAL